MNKILRKCREFGLIIRLPELETEEALNCVRSLKRGDIPLCIVDSKSNGWINILKEIAFKEDLFIAVENIESLEEAYTAAGNGAQFFILQDSNEELMIELKESGFFYIPRVSTIKELQICEDLRIECVLPTSSKVLDNTTLYCIEETKNKYKIKHKDNILFTIINLDKNISDYEIWTNDIVTNYLGFQFKEIIINKDSDDNLIKFGEIFSAINKCKIKYGIVNTIILECNDFNRTISYLKWKNLYINPNDVKIINNKIVQGHLDLMLNEYKIVVKERMN